MTWFECIIAAHTAVTDSVSHGGRMKSKRYFVWQEEAPDDLIADGKHIERAMIGTTDLFTTIEFDPWCEALEKRLTLPSISRGRGFSLCMKLIQNLALPLAVGGVRLWLGSKQKGWMLT